MRKEKGKEIEISNMKREKNKGMRDSRNLFILTKIVLLLFQ